MLFAAILRGLGHFTWHVSSTLLTECLKTGLEFCARVKSVAHKLQTISQEVKPQTEKFLVSDEHSHIKYMYYLETSAYFQYVQSISVDFLRRAN